MAKLKAFLLEKKLRLLQFLRNHNINDIFYTAYNKLRGSKAYIHQKKHTYTETIQLPKEEELSEIFIQKDNQFEFLRSIVYQYLYLSSINIKDIGIYQSTKNNNLFYIKSKSKILKILVTN